jgi:hypothetical protein
MLKRHVEECPLIDAEPTILPLLDAAPCGAAGDGVGGEGAGRAAKRLAGELIADQDERQRTSGTGQPAVETTAGGTLDQVSEAGSNRVVVGGAGREPARRRAGVATPLLSGPNQ